MPSPFPGMDPYLEGELFQEFHATLANTIRAQLVAQLPPHYAALLAKRYVLDRPALGVFDVPSARVFYPDVHVIREEGSAHASYAAPVSAPTPPTVEIESPTLAPQLAIEIRDVADRQLVTVIEILSPSNKFGDGGWEYRRRRADLLTTTAHVLEIDLLRAGERISLAVEPPTASYYVYLSRAERRPRTQVWAIQLPDRLPIVPVPLRAPDADVLLDLQAAVTDGFALVGYERLIDYRQRPPAPALDAATADWVAAQIASAGKEY